jgi:hypothetical protein
MYQMVNPLSGIEISGKVYLVITLERANTCHPVDAIN